jgi:hypothetical protein
LGGYPQRKTPEYVVKYGEIPWNPMKSPYNNMKSQELWWNMVKSQEIWSNHVLHNSCIFLLSCSASLDHFSLYKVAKPIQKSWIWIPNTNWTSLKIWQP